MQPLHTMVFDRFCEDGWTYWSDQIFRRNYWEWRGKPCRVILLRIDLRNFEFSKSQRKCLRRNEDLVILRRPIRIEPMHEALFERHSQRFRHNRPESIYGFFSAFSSLMPCYGIQFDVFSEDRLIATTHLQPAQLTTVGKRATLWMQDLVLDLAELDHRVGTLPMRGVKGTTGTQASFLEIFGGDHEKVRELDRRVTAAMDFASVIPVSGQTYSRKIDAQVLAVVAGIATSAAKFASDLRMLQAFGEIEEPFEREQIGSSAMAYKRNPMRCERINALARFVSSLEPNANQTHAVQYFERTLDDSANRRLVIPEAFLAADAILVLLTNVVGGLEVHPARIAARVRDELPFMATEELIVRAVRAGASRQDAHEVIRRHAIAAARSMKDDGRPNDMLARLAADPAFGVPLDDLTSTLDAERFVGRAPQQVDDFLAEVVEPVLAASDARGARGAREEVRV